MKLHGLTPRPDDGKLKSMNDLSGGVHRTVALLRLLATADESGLRLKDIADKAQSRCAPARGAGARAERPVAG